MMLVSCDDLPGFDYTPTQKQIEAWVPEFLPEDVLIEGLYGNMDAPSWLFRYTAQSRGEPVTAEHMNSIINRAEKEGWQLAGKVTTLHFQRFHRITEYEATAPFASEKARVIMFPQNGRVYVGGIHIRTRNPVTQFPESKFAEHTFWPLLQSYVVKEEQEIYPISYEAIEEP